MPGCPHGQCSVNENEVYTRRTADQELEERLSAAGAVLIEGPRACGKTETARRCAASEVLFDVDENARHAMAIDPALVLAGDRPRLIDEWQIEPAIWNHVRREVDRSRGPGQFILTGSAVPADDITRHTGAGRISRIRLRTMSSFEAGFSTGQVSLADLMRGRFEGCSRQSTTLADLAAHLSRAGPVMRPATTHPTPAPASVRGGGGRWRTARRYRLTPSPAPSAGGG